jgi:CRISPR-associated protein Cmr2
MQYDYYAFRKEQLGDHLSELEQASAELIQAKKQRDKNARQQTEKKIEQAAEKLVRIEPHLSYLWYEAQGSELKNPIRDAWQKYLTASPIPNDFHFLPNPSDLHHLPSNSFMLHVPFKLCKPYLSKDDRTFHLLDNSVRKDKVFQTPMIASTSWKGALRAALWQLDHKADDKTIVRLFGNAREDEKGQAGRLYFYPTFFDKIGLEVINPHDRKTGTGKTGPILLECVPANATGEFVLLYVPFGSVKSNEVAADLKLAAEGIQAMLTIYGFGAKTSSGFGIADIQGKGELAIRADLPDLVKTSPPNQKTDFLNDDGSLKQEFLNDDDGSFKTEKQYKTLLQSQGKAHESKLYKKAKQWWEANIEELVSESKSLQPITKVFFVGWDELSEQAQHMTEKLSSRGEV